MTLCIANCWLIPMGICIPIIGFMPICGTCMCCCCAAYASAAGFDIANGCCCCAGVSGCGCCCGDCIRLCVCGGGETGGWGSWPFWTDCNYSNRSINDMSGTSGAMPHLVVRKVLEERRPCRVGMENTKHLMTSIGEQLLGISRVSDRLAFLRVAANFQVRCLVTGLTSEIKTYFSLMCLRVALGMSLTKIHLTLKTPFHLSDAHTVLLRV